MSESKALTVGSKMAESKTLTVCYTDLKGSSDLNNKIGNDRMEALKAEHFKVEDELIPRNRGTPIKRLGDGSMSTFDNPAEAIAFSAGLQWIEAKHPGLQFWTFDTKIGMAHGEVKVSKDPPDVNGIGANLADRILKECQPGQILLDSEAHNVLKSQWGPEETGKYCTSLGHRALKDFGSQEVWAFDWSSYIQEKNTIAKLVEKQLTDAHFDLYNAVRVPLSKPGLIFWPVVPRPMNAIHKGQLEAIKVLSFCGWKTYLFIADSNRVFENTPPVSDNFEETVREYAKMIGVSLEEVKYLSRVFDSSSEEFPNLLTKFKQLIGAFKVRHLFGYEGKSYQGKREMVMDRTILDFLRTIFTLVAFQHFVDNHSQPVMIVAGLDELPKWKNYLETRHLCDRANVISNPELKRGGHLVQQDSYEPIWRSKHDFLEATKETNLTQWAFDLFVCLPQFPKTDFTICNQYCKKVGCGKKPESCGEVNKFADNVANTNSVKDRLEFV